MRRKSNGEFLKELRDKRGDEFTPLESYILSTTKIKFRHNKCGNVISMTPHAILGSKRNGCISCGYENMKTKQRKSDSQFKEEVKNLVGEDYTFTEKYVNNSTKLNVIHNKCGYEYSVTPSKFLNGRRCPECKNKNLSKIKTLPKCDFIGKFKNESNGEYELRSDYVNRTTKITVKHLDCGFIYEVTPMKFLCGNRCPRCRGSRGEREIESYLKDNDFVYESQFKIKECRNIHPLPFDFAVFNKNKELIFLIEYQGEQHFKEVKFFGGKEYLDKRKKLDAIKKKYCLDNSIPLIEISYLTENIKDEINKKISEIIPSRAG